MRKITGERPVQKPEELSGRPYFRGT